MTRVNVGCGMTPTRGWRNFDNSPSLKLARHGTLRISVPDVGRHVARYLETGDADEFIDKMHTCVPRPRSVLGRMREAAVGPRHHQWMYDGRSLAGLLQAEGFRDPVALPPGQTTIVSPEPLDLYERSDESVYVEARK